MNAYFVQILKFHSIHTLPYTKCIIIHEVYDIAITRQNHDCIKNLNYCHGVLLTNRRYHRFYLHTCIDILYDTKNNLHGKLKSLDAACKQRFSIAKVAN